MTKEEFVVTSAMAQNILLAQDILDLHAAGNNSGQCQICALGKYEEGSLLIETMTAKSGRNWLAGWLDGWLGGWLAG